MKTTKNHLKEVSGFKRHLYSAGVTFISTFLATFAVFLQANGIDTLGGSMLASAAFSAAGTSLRSAFKAFIEKSVNIES